jgi:hypothetical protein
MRVVKDTGGIAVVDYHARGMNADFYPRYGPWLRSFLAKHADFATVFLTPSEIVRIYNSYEAELEKHSSDYLAAADSHLSVSAGRI